MKRSLVLSLILVAASTVFMLRPVVAAGNNDAANGAATASSNGASTTHNPAATSPKHKHRTIDADDAYKNNCMRCHTGLPQYDPRMSKTIVMHMRVDGNIPGDEADALLDYLRGNN